MTLDMTLDKLNEKLSKVYQGFSGFNPRQDSMMVYGHIPYNNQYWYVEFYIGKIIDETDQVIFEKACETIKKTIASHSPSNKTNKMKPTIGRIVHYVQRKPAMDQPKDGPVALVHLPAIITAVWGDTCVNLQVLTDGTNSDEMNMAPVKWITSSSLDESATQERSWHWPERE